MGACYLEQIGGHVQDMRESRRLDKVTLARLCRVHVSIINGIESGSYKASYSFYEDICNVLGYTMRDLFGCFYWTYTPPAAGEESIEKN